MWIWPWPLWTEEGKMCHWAHPVGGREIGPPTSCGSWLVTVALLTRNRAPKVLLQCKRNHSDSNFRSFGLGTHSTSMRIPPTPTPRMTIAILLSRKTVEGVAGFYAENRTGNRQFVPLESLLRLFYGGEVSRLIRPCRRPGGVSLPYPLWVSPTPPLSNLPISVPIMHCGLHQIELRQDNPDSWILFD